MYDAILVGGGIIGSSIAWQLARRGKRVLVLERKDTGSGSAGATDGFVGCHTKKPGPQLDLAIQSIRMFDEIRAELGGEVDYEIGAGGMQPVEDKEQWDILSQMVEKQQRSGVDVRMIGPEEALEIVPQLSRDIYGALYSPTANKIDPLKLTYAFLRLAKEQGAEVINGVEVTGFILEHGRCVGVQSSKGEFRAPAVVNCCGAWAGETAKLAGLDLPIKPRKGQLAVTEPIGFYMSPTLQCARYNVIKFRPESIKDPAVLRLGSSMNIVQTATGGLVFGGTREFVGFQDENTFEAIETMCRRVLRFLPGLKDLSVIRFFAGFRPYTPDGLPLLGEVKTLPGFYMAAGHEGDGIAMSPITGKLMAELIVDGAPSYNIDAFSPNRFLS